MIVAAPTDGKHLGDEIDPDMTTVRFSDGLSMIVEKSVGRIIEF